MNLHMYRHYYWQTLKMTGCDDHMSICVRGYFGIRWLHITHTVWCLVIPTRHEAWVCLFPVWHSMFSLGYQGTLDWKLLYSITWLHLMSPDWTWNGLHEMLGGLFLSPFSACRWNSGVSGLLKWGSIVPSLFFHCKFMLMQFLSYYTNN